MQLNTNAVCTFPTKDLLGHLEYIMNLFALHTSKSLVVKVVTYN